MTALPQSIAKRLLKSRLKTFLYQQPDAPDEWTAAELLEESILKDCESEWRGVLSETHMEDSMAETVLRTCYHAAANDVRFFMLDHGANPDWLKEKMAEHRQKYLGEPS